MRRSRNRWKIAVALACVIALGLSSRRFASSLPMFISEYAGDTLWATAVYLGFRLFLVRAPIIQIALAALLFSYAIETSQLYHAPWIDSIRATPIGGLILGFGFLWSDVVCYFVGVLVGAMIDRLSLTRVGASDHGVE